MGKDSRYIVADFGRPNSEPQERFFASKAKYTCYGGARGGGKSWAIQRKAPLDAYKYSGLRILIIRREYGDMENTIISPMLKILPQGTYQYNKTDHMITFANGSTIKFGNMPGYGAAVQGKYQGQEYDELFIDEATQFTETEFRGLCAIVRGANKFPKRIFLTCNPGGVGHFWVKRIFVDRDFKKGEDPHDYLFIPATVRDNKDLMENNSDYIKQLEMLPDDIRDAHLNGNWEALGGAYFQEFRDGVHTCKPFPIPKHWQHYRAMDYGLDMFFCIWVAVDEHGRHWVYRIFDQSNMLVSEAAEVQLSMTRPDENINFTIAPPDMWARSRDTGKNQAAIFAEHGVGLVKADNNRKAGWAAMKEMFRIQPDGRPNLIIFDTCGDLIDCVKCIQRDANDPNDCRKTPHEITHGPDALRYYAQSYVLSAEKQVVEEEEEGEFFGIMDYHTAMCGTGVSKSYILS